MPATKKRRRCGSCQLLRINGVVCHETGCPEAWKDRRPACKWCGTTFRPKAKHQETCSASCARSYHG